MEPVFPRVPTRPHLPHFEGENHWSRYQRISLDCMTDDGPNRPKEIYTNRSEVLPWSDGRAQGERTALKISPLPTISQKTERVWISP